MREPLKYMVIGSNSMVGHVVALQLQELNNNVIGYDSKAGLCPSVETVVGDFHDLNLLTSLIQKGKFDAVVNCTAVVNDAAEKNKSEAAFINGFFPHFLEEITKETNTIIVHRSTDCIFSGDKGRYSLDDTPDGKSFYARTKAVGELVNRKDISLRTSLIGPELDINGKSLFNWFFYQKGDVKGFANAIWTGLTTIEFAKVIDCLVRKKSAGVFQCVPSCSISKYELLNLFETYFPGNRRVVKVENQRVDKSLIQELGGAELDIPGYEAMINDMKHWIYSHKEIYLHYFN